MSTIEEQDMNESRIERIGEHLAAALGVEYDRHEDGEWIDTDGSCIAWRSARDSSEIYFTNRVLTISEIEAEMDQPLLEVRNRAISSIASVTWEWMLQRSVIDGGLDRFRSDLFHDARFLSSLVVDRKVEDQPSKTLSLVWGWRESGTYIGTADAPVDTDRLELVEVFRIEIEYTGVGIDEAGVRIRRI